MTGSFFETQILQYIPEWFKPVFIEKSRLCLPYLLSMRDIDSIMGAVGTDKFLFLIGSDTNKVFRHLKSVSELSNEINDLVFQNVPENVVIELEPQTSWIYFDGDQRFSAFICSRELLRRTFDNSIESMRLYFSDQSELSSLSEMDRLLIFDTITTL